MSRLTFVQMLPKILVAVFAFVGNMVVQWYGNFSGKLPSKGSYLGIAYDSLFVRALVTQLEYIWVLILINVLFTMTFSLGFGSFKNFLSMAIIWLAMGPIAALIFNAFVLKEKINLVALMGVALLIIGSVFVIANKEIAALFNK